MSELINFFSEEINFKLKNKIKIRKWICKVIEKEEHISGNINIIFCSDDFLMKLNRKYLKHNTFTDIITFPMTEEEKIIGGDLYISKERVFENAKTFKIKPTLEILRVIIHGILHLLGYDDRSEEERENMRRKEDFYLKILDL